MPLHYHKFILQMHVGCSNHRNDAVQWSSRHGKPIEKLSPELQGEAEREFSQDTCRPFLVQIEPRMAFLPIPTKRRYEFA